MKKTHFVTLRMKIGLLKISLLSRLLEKINRKLAAAIQNTNALLLIKMEEENEKQAHRQRQAHAETIGF